MKKITHKIMVGAALCVLAGNAFASTPESGRFSITDSPKVLAEALMDELGSPDIRLSVARFSVAGTNQHYGLTDIVASDMVGNYELVDVVASYGNRFSAVLSNADQKIAVHGRYDDYVEVPVIRGSFSKGDIISKSDIDWLAMPASRVRKSVITQADNLVGMEVVRRVMAGKPIQSRDVKKPIMVEKNAMVTVVYSTEFIDLKMTGMALQNASIGDVIRIKNTKSGAMLQGMINERGEAVVNYGDMLVSQQSDRNNRERG